MTQEHEAIGRQTADVLNRDCHCIAVNKQALHDSLQAHLRDSDLPERLLATHDHLFAESPVFLWQGHIEKMTELIRAIESVTHHAAYRESVLAAAPASARTAFGPRGVFFGYDFHLGADGPRLIEINTNAGGVLLNLYLAAAQQACCVETRALFDGAPEFADAENDLVGMFREEWKLQRPQRPLERIAIVDNHPSEQFLYPEFLLFQSLFKRHGIDAVIADPEDFCIERGALWLGEQRIDLVYNRLTDFYLERPESARVLEAYQSGLVVLSPSPHHYALYADKHNLTLFSDAARLEGFGVPMEVIRTLGDSLPPTVAVTSKNADQLWKERRQLFFKPATGYGSRGAFRGAKLTRRVWQEILEGDYIAQAIVAPSERHLEIKGEIQPLKLDIRCVTYDGKIQQLSARLYQGQTTNLRTEGGGLATVFPTPSALDAPC